MPYPLFGLTSLLDADPSRLPEGLDATAARPDVDELAVAARACADLLRAASSRPRARIGFGEGGSPMAAWVSERLR